MKIQLVILFSLFSISLAYAHPNHMSFENIQHNTVQIKSTITSQDKLNQTLIEEHHHSDTVPCVEEQQHKSLPCKKK
ncbi:MAG: hypothetical protein OQL19_03935 [Gammaproteobacteria bacterium]|nr:hypothetical protein [Gammaproteobacteria bacterium]